MSSTSAGNTCEWQRRYNSGRGDDIITTSCKATGTVIESLAYIFNANDDMTEIRHCYNCGLPVVFLPIDWHYDFYKER